MMKQARLIITTYKGSLSFPHRDYASSKFFFFFFGGGGRGEDSFEFFLFVCFLVREGVEVARQGERDG